METRELYLTRDGELEVPSKEDVVHILSFHQYLCRKTLRTLEAPFHCQETKDYIMAHTLRHLERMGSSILRYLESG